MRIVFAGTPDFAVPSLERLLAVHEVVAVLSRPARPTGRGRRVQEPAVSVHARGRSLPVLAPENPNDPAFLEELRRLAPDLVAVVSFGKILSEAFLAVPRHGCVNVHFSLLPEYRGASPVQSALAEGRTETGVTVFRLVRRMDAGPVLGARAVEIEPGLTAGEMLERLGEVGAELLAEVVGRIGDGTAVAVEQDESKATYCRPLSKDDGRIDWSRPAREVVDRFRAATPWPGAFTWHLESGTRIVVVRAIVLSAGGSDPADPGRVVAAGPEGLDVATGGGVVRILEVQPAGKRAMSAAEFVRGRRLGPSDRLGTPA